MTFSKTENLDVAGAIQLLESATSLEQLRANKAEIERHRDAGTLHHVYECGPRSGRMIRMAPGDLTRIYAHYQHRLNLLTNNPLDI